jgi:Spy/CpxP family protein refolding chaperone
MKRRNAIIATILVGTLATVAVAGTANAFPGGGGGGCRHGHGAHHGMGMGGGFAGGPEGRIMRMADKLNLNKEQREKVWKIVDSQRSAAREKMYSMMESRKALREASRGKDFDAKKIRSLADAQGKTIADLMVMKAETMHQIRGVLTPEQQAQLDKMREHRRHRWSDKRS